MKAKQDKSETQGEQASEPPRKWWRRYGDGDWRWSDESWQTEASKSRRTEPQGR